MAQSFDFGLLFQFSSEITCACVSLDNQVWTKSQPTLQRYQTFCQLDVRTIKDGDGLNIFTENHDWRTVFGKPYTGLSLCIKYLFTFSLVISPSNQISMSVLYVEQRHVMTLR